MFDIPIAMFQEQPQKIIDQYETRLTSYYPTRGDNATGCGLDVNDFEVNEYGWYTYQGKLVIATATEYLLNYGWRYREGVRLYHYYDELILTIDGVDYPAIVLDSCGACMTTGRVDLFVVNRNAVIDQEIVVTEIENNEMI